jgi:uncharacterized protein (TIGR00725 family)
MRRLPIVGVMGSGSEAHEAAASRLGRWLAEEGVHLLTGGGGGVMAAVSHAFHETPGREGLVIGVIPCAEDNPAQPKPGYPNPWVELPIMTHLPLSGTRGTDPLSRNHINVLTADVLIALPGGAGTHSELELAKQYGRPIAVFAPGDDFDELQAFVRKVLAR